MSARDGSSGSDDLLPAGSGVFNTTHWTEVLLAGKTGSPEADSALEELCRTYWYPLYAFARRQGQNPSDAQDLTQQFFAVFLEKKYFSLADPNRGRFRSFLLASFKHFLANEHHRSKTIKRGGRTSFVSWDEALAETQYHNELSSYASPDKLFEHAWALTLLDKVMKELQREYSGAGKAKVFEALQVFLTGNRSEATYEEIGRGLAMSEAAIKMAVSRLRRRYGDRLREEIAQTVGEPSMVEEELRYLAGTLAS